MSIQPFDPGRSPPTLQKRGLLGESGPLPGETPPATAATEPNPPQASGFTSGASWQAPDNPAPRDYSALRPVGGGVVGDNGQQVGVGNPQAAMGPASGGLIDPATLMAMHDRAGYEQYRGGGIDAALGTVGANIAARAREGQYVQQMNAWRQNQASTDRAAMEAMLGGSGAPAATPAAAPIAPTAAGQPQPAVPARGFFRSPDHEQGPAARGLAAGATPAPAAAAPPPQQAAADPNTLPMGQYNQYMQKQADLARIYGQSPDPAVRAKGLAIAQQIQQQQNPLVQAQLQRDYQKAGLDIQQEEANIRKAEREAQAGVVVAPGSRMQDPISGKIIGPDPMAGIDAQIDALGGRQPGAVQPLSPSQALADGKGPTIANAQALTGAGGALPPGYVARAGGVPPAATPEAATGFSGQLAPQTIAAIKAEIRAKGGAADIQRIIASDPYRIAQEAEAKSMGTNAADLAQKSQTAQGMALIADELERRLDKHHKDDPSGLDLVMGPQNEGEGHQVADRASYLGWNGLDNQTYDNVRGMFGLPSYHKSYDYLNDLTHVSDMIPTVFRGQNGTDQAQGMVKDLIGRTIKASSYGGGKDIIKEFRNVMLPAYSQQYGGATLTPPTAQTPPPMQNGPVQIKHDGDYNALPSGAHFIDPNGQERIKP